jgi:hypothetical protein
MTELMLLANEPWLWDPAGCRRPWAWIIIKLQGVQRKPGKLVHVVLHTASGLTPEYVSSLYKKLQTL